MLCVFILSSREGLFVIDSMPFIHYLMETQIMQETNSAKALIYVSFGSIVYRGWEGERFL